MALNTQLSNAAANAAVAALAALVNGGSIVIYTGGQPANGNSALTGTLLATLPLNATAFGAAANGQVSLNTTPNAVQATAVATGTAGYAAFLNSGGQVEWMVSVGTASANIVMTTTSIQQGATVQITSYTLSIAEAGN